VPLAAPAKQLKAKAIPPPSDDLASDDIPLATTVAVATPGTPSTPVPKATKSKNGLKKGADSDDDDDVPLGSRSKPSPAKAAARANGVTKKRVVKDESDSDDDVPLRAKKLPKVVSYQSQTVGRLILTWSIDRKRAKTRAHP
jgi:hypothetical protein